MWFGGNYYYEKILTGRPLSKTNTRTYHMYILFRKYNLKYLWISTSYNYSRCLKIFAFKHVFAFTLLRFKHINNQVE